MTHEQYIRMAESELRNRKSDPTQAAQIIATLSNAGCLTGDFDSDTDNIIAAVRAYTKHAHTNG
jgi:hypothetical protein